MYLNVGAFYLDLGSLGGVNVYHIHPGKLTCPLKRDYFNRKYI